MPRTNYRSGRLTMTSYTPRRRSPGGRTTGLKDCPDKVKFGKDAKNKLQVRKGMQDKQVRKGMQDKLKDAPGG